MTQPGHNYFQRLNRLKKSASSLIMKTQNIQLMNPQVDFVRITPTHASIGFNVASVALFVFILIVIIIISDGVLLQSE